MNTIRMIAIALPITLLLACGGGGGGTAAVAPTTAPPTTTPPTTGDPNMPPTTTPTVNPLANLANFEPSTGHSSIRMVSAITMANNANLLTSSQAQADSFGSELSVPCILHFCNTSLPGETSGELLMFLRANVEDISLIRNTSYFANNEYTSTVTSDVTVNGVALARGNLTGTRKEGTTPFESQSFAGWLDGSVFGTMQITIGESGSEQYRFISYIVGVPSGSNPSSTGSATWEGAAVASIKADRTFILGDAEITVNFTDTDVDLMLDNWRGLDNQAVSSVGEITYEDLNLTSGSFTSSKSNEQVQRRFYGTTHAEVGGFFNTATVAGAFGGTRQTGQ